MSSSLAGFGDSAYELVLGSPPQTLYVPADVLRNISYFAKAFRHEDFKEAKEKRFEMPEVDPEAAVKVLERTYVYTITSTTYYAVPTESYDILEELKAWIVADAWGVDVVTHSLESQIMQVFLTRSLTVTPEMLMVFDAADHHHSDFYKCIISQWDWEVKNARNCERPSKIRESAAGLRQLSSTLLVDILSAVEQTTRKNMPPIKRRYDLYQ